MNLLPFAISIVLMIMAMLIGWAARRDSFSNGKRNIIIRNSDFATGGLLAGVGICILVYIVSFLVEVEWEWEEIPRDISSLLIASLWLLFIIARNLNRYFFKPIQRSQKRNVYCIKKMPRYILKQYLLYAVSILIFWILLLDGSKIEKLDPHDYAVLFLVVLTIDDWNSLSKYFTKINIEDLRIIDLTKYMFVAVALSSWLTYKIFAPFESMELVSGIFGIAVLVLAVDLMIWSYKNIRGHKNFSNWRKW